MRTWDPAVTHTTAGKTARRWILLACPQIRLGMPAVARVTRVRHHCPISLVTSCTVSAVSGHLLSCVRSLWSSPVLCPQSLVISCTVSAV
ncbi:unnamed protein product, partial [Staurois parvus]